MTNSKDDDKSQRQIPNDKFQKRQRHKFQMTKFQIPKMMIKVKDKFQMTNSKSQRQNSK